MTKSRRGERTGGSSPRARRRPARFPPTRAKVTGGNRAARQGLSSARSRRRIGVAQQKARLTMRARITKQGINAVIIPNKAHWYASIALSARLRLPARSTLAPPQSRRVQR